MLLRETPLPGGGGEHQPPPPPGGTPGGIPKKLLKVENVETVNEKTRKMLKMLFWRPPAGWVAHQPPLPPGGGHPGGCRKSYKKLKTLNVLPKKL